MGRQRRAPDPLSALEVRPDILRALEAGEPVVALESTVIAHGLPRPQNLEIARRLEAAVREEGAAPATVGLVDGRAVVGLDESEIERLATEEPVAKVSLRDFAPALAAGGLGATTVAATAHLAAAAGIRVFATGGIGGVHRLGPETLDVSADLIAMSRAPVAVVSAGAKSILDHSRTLELLESLGIPVVGYGTDRFPAFYTAESDHLLAHRVDTPEEAARVMAAQWGLQLTAGILFCVPPPGEIALAREQVQALVARAEREARKARVSGPELTPWMLERLAMLSEGETIVVNEAILFANARIGARIAAAWAAIRK